MHALLITFRSSADLDRLAGRLAEYAGALHRVDGLVSTAWVQDGETLGGFHVFASQKTAEAYLAGDLMARLRAHPAFTRFHVRRYAVLDALSQTTGTPQPSSACCPVPPVHGHQRNPGEDRPACDHAPESVSTTHHAGAGA